MAETIALPGRARRAGDGPCRPDAAVDQHHRLVPRAGPRGGRLGADRGRCQGGGGGRRILGGDRGGGRAAGAQDHRADRRSRPSASARAPPATVRSWCWRTCSACRRGCRNSSSATAISARGSRRRSRLCRRGAGSSLPGSGASLRDEGEKGLRGSIRLTTAVSGRRDLACLCLARAISLFYPQRRPEWGREHRGRGQFVSDIFHEVDEEIRRERLRKLWERYSGLILFARGRAGGGDRAAGAATNVIRRSGRPRAARNSRPPCRLPKPASSKRRRRLRKIAADGTSGYRALARLRAAAEPAPGEQGCRRRGFRRDLRRQLRRPKFARPRRHSRRLPPGRQRAAVGNAAALEPLPERKPTFRHTARELLALSAFFGERCCSDQALGDMITGDLESPAAMRGRVEALLALAGIPKG